MMGGGVHKTKRVAEKGGGQTANVMGIEGAALWARGGRNSSGTQGLSRGLNLGKILAQPRVYEEWGELKTKGVILEKVKDEKGASQL